MNIYQKDLREKQRLHKIDAFAAMLFKALELKH